MNGGYLQRDLPSLPTRSCLALYPKHEEFEISRIAREIMTTSWRCSSLPANLNRCLNHNTGAKLSDFSHVSKVEGRACICAYRGSYIGLSNLPAQPRSDNNHRRHIHFESALHYTICTMSLHAPPDSFPGFLFLPKELRLIVYERVTIASRHHQIRLRNRDCTLILRSFPISLLATNKLVHDEALDCWKVARLFHELEPRIMTVAMNGDRTILNLVLAINNTTSALMEAARPSLETALEALRSKSESSSHRVFKEISAGYFHVTADFIWRVAMFTKVCLQRPFNIQVGIPIGLHTDIHWEYHLVPRDVSEPVPRVALKMSLKASANARKGPHWKFVFFTDELGDVDKYVFRQALGTLERSVRSDLEAETLTAEELEHVRSAQGWTVIEDAEERREWTGG